MPDLTSVSDFPPWSIDWQFSQENPITRTSFRGFKRQARFSKRQVTLAPATRKLTGIELPYFESFVRNQANDGQLKFIDKYKDGGGVQSGTVRIVNGKYTVVTNGINHTVSCQLEVFR
jgi:hypothetical protein